MRLARSAGSTWSEYVYQESYTILTTSSDDVNVTGEAMSEAPKPKISQLLEMSNIIPNKIYKKKTKTLHYNTSCGERENNKYDMVER